jgi:hypothetical protein
MLEGRTPPSLTEAQYTEKGQLYSELEGSATPHSYSLKRGSQIHSKSSEKKNNGDEEGARAKQTIN